MLAHQATNAIAFRSQHQGDVAAGCGLGQGLLAIACQRHAPETGFGQPVEGAGDIHHLDIGQDLQGAGSRLGQRARQRRGMAVLNDHGTDSESGGSTQNGADIVGVGKLVQHQYDPAPAAGIPFQHLIQIGGG